MSLWLFCRTTLRAGEVRGGEGEEEGGESESPDAVSFVGPVGTAPPPPPCFVYALGRHCRLVRVEVEDPALEHLLGLDPRDDHDELLHLPLGQPVSELTEHLHEVLLQALLLRHEDGQVVLGNGSEGVGRVDAALVQDAVCKRGGARGMGGGRREGRVRGGLASPAHCRRASRAQIYRTHATLVRPSPPLSPISTACGRAGPPRSVLEQAKTKTHELIA
jgi:hypothetical protein